MPVSTHLRLLCYCLLLCDVIADLLGLAQHLHSCGILQDVALHKACVIASKEVEQPSAPLQDGIAGLLGLIQHLHSCGILQGDALCKACAIASAMITQCQVPLRHVLADLLGLNQHLHTAVVSSRMLFCTQHVARTHAMPFYCRCSCGAPGFQQVSSGKQVEAGSSHTRDVTLIKNTRRNGRNLDVGALKSKTTTITMRFLPLELFLVQHPLTFSSSAPYRKIYGA
eukprot:1158867-Pelagomonas_calceolata.AAC.15